LAIPEKFIDELVSRCDIVDVVSDYVSLKRKGSNYFGLCPFHGEKTASFSVAPNKQIYHCFGCSKGGGVINFIMEVENLSFVEAVEFLANRAGLQMPQTDEPVNYRKKRERTIALMTDAARFYHKLLRDEKSGSEVLEYLKRRKLSSQYVIKFGIGYAPDTWDTLVLEMTKKGYTKRELMDAGLAIAGKNGGVYDRFRGRLMFPILNVKGEVIGFGGRIMGAGEPKYLNSPDTPVFDKRLNLFALNIAKKTKRDACILCEGYMDVISMHQAGFDNAVASLGTALTEEQARLIARYFSKVILIYDSDDAGKNAAQRAIKILEKLDLSIKVVTLEGAKDPDEFIKKNGASAFEVLLTKGDNHIEYRLLVAKSRFDLSDDNQKVEYLKEAVKILAQVGNAVECEVHASRVSRDTGVGLSGIMHEVERERKKKRAQEKKREVRVSPAISAQPIQRSIRYQNLRSAVAEENVLALLSADHTLKCGLKGSDFSCEFLGKVYDRIKSESFNLGTLAMDLTPDEMSRVTEIIDRPCSLNNAEQAMSDYERVILDEKKKREENYDPLKHALEKFKERN